MKKKDKLKISTEVAIGIIISFSIVVAIAVYKAGSFSEALTYIVPRAKNNNQSTQDNNWVLFASHGERKVYKVQKEDGKWAVIIDGQEGEAYDDVFDPTFSKDGTNFAYGARNDGWEFTVLNNKTKGKKYEKVSQLIFDNDGVLIYKVSDESGEYLVIGEEEGDKYTSIGEIVILDDGRIAFQAEVDGETVTIIDGEIVTEEQTIGGGGAESEVPDDSITVVPVMPIKEVKVERQKKDQVIPVTEESYSVCNGIDCNF